MDKILEHLLDVMSKVGVNDARRHLADLRLEQMELVLSVSANWQDVFFVELVLMKRGLEVGPVVSVQLLPLLYVPGNSVLDIKPERPDLVSKHRHHALELRVLLQVLREEVESVRLQSINLGLSLLVAKLRVEDVQAALLDVLLQVVEEASHGALVPFWLRLEVIDDRLFRNHFEGFLDERFSVRDSLER